MGRPLNRRHFGNPSLEGKQVVVTQAWFAGEVGPVSTGPGSAPGTSNILYLDKQIGTGRYIVRWDIENSTTHELISTKSQGLRLVSLEEFTGTGLAIMHVTPVVTESPLTFGPVEYARVIFNRSVKTWQGHRYSWSTEDATKFGQANLPLEGTA